MTTEPQSPTAAPIEQAEKTESPIARLREEERRPHPMLELIIARTREFYREPEVIFWVYGFPLLMAVALGIAFRNQPVEQIIVDIQQSPSAHRVADALKPDEGDSIAADAEFDHSPQFEVRIVTAEEGRRRLRSGKTALIVVPSGEESEQLDVLEFEYIYDPTRPDSRSARAAVNDRLERAAGRADTLATVDREVSEPGGRYIDFLIPGLLGMSLLGGGLFGIGFVTVDMRVRHLLKRFITTPMKKTHFLASLMISRFMFAITEVVLLLVFARYFFDVRVTGSWLSMIGLLVLGALTFSGMGLLVACRAKTLETVSGLVNLAMLPMWLLSGVFFSYERFPEVAHPLIRLLPLTALNDALRAVSIEGALATSLLPEIIVMTGWMVLSFVVALRFFRWT